MIYDEANRVFWEQRDSQIDSIVSNFISDRNWDDIVPECDTESFRSFCKHLIYVISKFLETDNEAQRELFIKIPVQEFCNRDEQQEDALQINRWRSVINAVVACLSLATVEQTKMNAMPVRNQYMDRDRFVYFNIRNNAPRICQYNSYTGRMEGDQGADIAFRNSPYYFRVRNDFVVNGRNAGNSLIEVINTRNQIESESAYEYHTQYSSAVLVSLGAIRPSTTSVIWKSGMIQVPIKLTTNEQSATASRPDIIVAFGDYKYKGCYNRYKNSNARKIIYVGSDAPYDDVPTYAFSYHEIYRYCRTAEHLSFKEPVFVPLRFEWLEERRQDLTNLLNDCSDTDASLTDDVISRCVTRLLRPFSYANFDSEKLARLKEGMIDNNGIDSIFPIDVDIATIDRVMEWYRGLTFNGTNPKQDYINGHDCDLSIFKSDSYRQRVGNLMGDNKSIIVDNLAFHRYDDRYEYILRYLLFADITSVYYEGFEDISQQTVQRFFTEELNLLRLRPYETNIVPVQNAVENVNYDTYFEEEYHWIDRIYEPGNNVSFLVYFEDGSSEYVDGDIIVDFGEGFERIKISDLIERHHRGSNCVYYKRPDEIDNLMCTGMNIPVSIIDRVDNYSALWKERYKRVFERYSQNEPSIRATVDTIFSHCRISKNSLRKYSREDTIHKFLVRNDMMAMCDFLIAEGVLTNEEKNGVMKSREFLEKKKGFGRNLKDVVFSLFLNEEIVDVAKLALLQKLNEGGYNRDRLMEMTLVQNRSINNIIITEQG